MENIATKTDLCQHPPTCDWCLKVIEGDLVTVERREDHEFFYHTGKPPLNCHDQWRLVFTNPTKWLKGLDDLL